MSRCEVCGSGEAAYVCSRCSKRICHGCFEPFSWTCKLCYKASPMEGREVLAPWATSTLAKAIFIIGLAMIFIGFVSMLLLPISGPVKSSGGIVIFIGPLPIALGVGPSGLELVISAIMLLAIMILILLILRRI